MKTTTWAGCYDSNWNGFITPASFSHPAKMARGLLERIIAHGFAKGYWEKGSIIGDCFGGVGTTGVIGAYNGLHVVSVELEPKFVSLARRNYALHSAKWKRLGVPRPVLLQGDSRQFHRIIGEIVAIVSSPPYAVISTGAGGLNTKPAKHPGQQSGRKADSASQDTDQRYGQTKGQIATLKEGSIDGVISSPPYADAKGTPSVGHPEKGGLVGGDILKRCTTGARPGDERYGETEGQIGRLSSGDLNAVVTSPPWEKNAEGSRKAGKFKNPTAILKCNRGHGASDAAVLAQAARDEQKVYGDSPGQIGQLKGGNIDGVVTSPPYAANEKSDYLMSEDGKTRARDIKRGFKQGHGSFRGSESYGDSDGQIGRLRETNSDESKESYWQAMNLVYRSCYQAIKPSGVIVLVVKDYVKAKKRVPLCDDTVRLLEHVGFTMVERIHAMLVKETRHEDLFGGHTIEKTERKSFFRRLAEKKGSPQINFEEVLIARK